MQENKNSDPGNRYIYQLQGSKNVMSNNGTNCWYHICLLTCPEATECLLWSLWRPPKYWSKTGESTIILSHMQVPSRQGKENAFNKEGKEIGRALVNKESMAFYWRSPSQERRGVFFLLGSAIFTAHVSSPSWYPDSILLGFCSVIFIIINNIMSEKSASFNLKILPKML